MYAGNFDLVETAHVVTILSTVSNAGAGAIAVSLHVRVRQMASKSPRAVRDMVEDLARRSGTLGGLENSRIRAPSCGHHLTYAVKKTSHRAQSFIPERLAITSSSC